MLQSHLYTGVTYRDWFIKSAQKMQALKKTVQTRNIIQQGNLGETQTLARLLVHSVRTQ